MWEFLESNLPVSRLLVQNRYVVKYWKSNLPAWKSMQQLGGANPYAKSSIGYVGNFGVKSPCLTVQDMWGNIRVKSPCVTTDKLMQSILPCWVLLVPMQHINQVQDMWEILEPKLPVSTVQDMLGNIRVKSLSVTTNKLNSLPCWVLQPYSIGQDMCEILEPKLPVTAV